LFTVFVNSLTWTGRAAGSSSSGIRRASPAVAAAAASHLAGVILFALQPCGSLYVCVLTSKRCKWLYYDNTACRNFGVSGEAVGRVGCRPGH